MPYMMTVFGPAFAICCSSSSPAALDTSNLSAKAILCRRLFAARGNALSQRELTHGQRFPWRMFMNAEQERSRSVWMEVEAPRLTPLAGDAEADVLVIG